MVDNTRLPARFVTRDNLQKVYLRCSDLLAKSLSEEESLIISSLCSWAVTADAYLSSLEEEYSDSKQHKHLFDSPSSISSKWCATKVSLHTGKGLFFVCMEQQVLTRGREVYPARRYRLRLGSPEAEPIQTNDLSRLLPHMREYLNKFDDFLPMPAQAIMSSMFAGDNISPVENLKRGV